MKDSAFYKDGLPNADYHAHEAISKSQLDHIARSPALLEWSKNAPRDEDAVKAFDFGTALHALILEPEMFAATYVREPKFDRRTNAGKAEAAAFAEEHAEKSLLSDADYTALMLTRESALAHPIVRKIIEAEGVAERSYFWTDAETGVRCRCRPDRELTKMRWFVDLKSTDKLAQFHYSTVDYRYYVQDAYYSEGYAAVTGEALDAFLFVAVGKTRSAGRYPVEVYTLPTEVKEEGAREVRRCLRLYADCLDKGVFPGVQTLEMPPSFMSRIAAKV